MTGRKPSEGIKDFLTATGLIVGSIALIWVLIAIF